MEMRRVSHIACALALTVSVPAVADDTEYNNYFSPMISLYDDDKDRVLDDGVSGGKLGLGFILNKNWNLEAMLAVNNADGSPAEDHLEVGADLQRVFNRDGGFSPYLFAGVSQLFVDVDNGNNYDGTAVGVGVGALAKIFGDSDVAVRGEYRYRMDDADFDDQFVSLGLVFPFGANAPSIPTPPADPDSDGDGVPDSRDRCLSTPAGVQVDASGCPLDGDKDGVADYIDKCPNTYRGATVDVNGCEMDGDKDGVVDRLDRCPNTRAGAQVDVAGCEIKEEIQLPGVNFESNAATLLSGTERVLNDAAETLKRNPEIKVEVAGHTDSDGAAAYNQDLSARRAETVRAYLASRGVAADRMTVRGYGEAEPIATNTTPTGKAQNRRVVLRVTER